LPDDIPLRGVIRPGSAPPVYPATRVAPATLPEVEQAVGKITTGFAVALPVRFAYRVTPPAAMFNELTRNDTTPGRVTFGLVVVVPNEPGGVRVTLTVRYIEVGLIGGTIP